MHRNYKPLYHSQRERNFLSGGYFLVYESANLSIRGFQPPDAKCNTGQIRIPNGRQPTKNAVSGHDRYCQKVNRTPAGLEHDPYAKGYLLCGKYACLTLMSKDI